MQQRNQMNLLLLSTALYFSDVNVAAFTIPSSKAFTSTPATFTTQSTTISNKAMMTTIGTSIGTNTGANTNSSTSLQMAGGRFSQWSNRRAIKSNSLFPKSPQRFSFSLLSKLKRTIAIFLTSTFLLLGPIQLNQQQQQLSMHPPAAHASSITATATPTTPKSKASASLDKIINEYVQENMFNDDLYDPVESTYRETIADSTTGAYPSQLSSAAQAVLGKKLPQPTKATSGDGQAIKFVLRLVDTIDEKFGGKIPKSFIVPVLFLIGGGIPTVLALAALMSFSYNQKAMTERMAVERYGESVLDAEEVIVKDDDDDDDDDDGKDDDGDDDDSDSDDEDED